jgi:hypothetical protein
MLDEQRLEALCVGWLQEISWRSPQPHPLPHHMRRHHASLIPRIISANNLSARLRVLSMRQASSGVAVQSRTVKSASWPGWKLPMWSSR